MQTLRRSSFFFFGSTQERVREKRLPDRESDQNAHQSHRRPSGSTTPISSSARSTGISTRICTLRCKTGPARPLAPPGQPPRSSPLTIRPFARHGEAKEEAARDDAPGSCCLGRDILSGSPTERTRRAGESSLCTARKTSCKYMATKMASDFTRC